MKIKNIYLEKFFGKIERLQIFRCQFEKSYASITLSSLSIDSTRTFSCHVPRWSTKKMQSNALVVIYILTYARLVFYVKKKHNYSSADLKHINKKYFCSYSHLSFNLIAVLPFKIIFLNLYWEKSCNRSCLFYWLTTIWICF